MNNIDKWAAEQCGVAIAVYTKGWLWRIDDNYHYDEWTIQDPRCREIVRERFRFDTEAFSTTGWECYHRDMDKFFSGKTIAEAEIACITAIYEAEASSEAREARDD